jgi:hypothetical protein
MLEKLLKSACGDSDSPRQLPTSARARIERKLRSVGGEM